jgi:hypothetical protein
LIAAAALKAKIGTELSTIAKPRAQAPKDKNKSAEIKKVEQTLHTLLTAIENHKRPSDDGKIICIADWSPYSALERDPIGHSLREGVHTCGLWLWNLTRSTDRMRESLHRVARNSARRMSIMDRCWDGVGGKWFS